MAITTQDLTQATLEGSGVFDVLMRTTKAHLEAEFAKGRIKGPEYSTVYLGSLTQVLQTAVGFLLAREKTDLEAQLLTKQIALADAQLIQLQKQTLLIEQQTRNAVTENTVLVAQECKLRAEFDHIMANVTRVGKESELLTQKIATERAQVLPTGVDPDSIVGRQKGLYLAQTNGFTRDAEQKAAKLMADTWNVRRTTDEATQANGTNMLDDTAVGRAINRMLTGVGA